MKSVTKTERMCLFGNKLRTSRIVSGMTQQQFSTAVGVAKNTVSAWERGTQIPHPNIIDKIILILGMNESEARFFKLRHAEVWSQLYRNAGRPGWKKTSSKKV